MNIKKIIKEAVGWYGAIAIIGSFALVSFELISPATMLYQILNGTGALGLAYISFEKKAYQPGVLNIIWVLIAGVAIVRLLI